MALYLQLNQNKNYSLLNIHTAVCSRLRSRSTCATPSGGSGSLRAGGHLSGGGRSPPGLASARSSALCGTGGPARPGGAGVLIMTAVVVVVTPCHRT